MIAVSFALPQESRSLIARLSGAQQLSAPPLPALIGSLGRQTVAIFHTGIGPESAAHKTREMFRRHRPQGLISSGFAGSLDPRLGVGDIVIATNFSEASLLDATRHLSERMEGRCYFGTLLTRPAVVETRDSKFFLGRQTGASAVDMETAAIAEACRDCSIPLLSVRAISDRADQSLPVPFAVWFDARRQAPRAGALLAFLLRHPARVRPFAAFVRGIPRARKKLAAYLEALIRMLPGPGEK